MIVTIFIIARALQSRCRCWPSGCSWPASFSSPSYGPSWCGSTSRHATLELGARGRASRGAPHDARDLRFLGRPGEPAARLAGRIVRCCTGEHSWLYYADRLVEFPMGMFTHCAGHGSAAGALGASRESVTAAVCRDARLVSTLVFLFVTPAAVGLLVLAGPLIATIYGYGRFSGRDVEMATYALMAYSLGLIGFSMVKVLAPGLLRAPGHAHAGSRRRDLACRQHGVQRGHRVAGRQGRISGAARAARRCRPALSAFVNSALLFRGLRRAGVYRAAPGWPRLRRRRCCLRTSPWRCSCGGSRVTLRGWLDAHAGAAGVAAERLCARRRGDLFRDPMGVRLAPARPADARSCNPRSSPYNPGIWAGLRERPGTVLMELVRGLHNLRARHRGCAVTIGKFDGVHLGHQAMLDRLGRHARVWACPRRS